MTASKSKAAPFLAMLAIAAQFLAALGLAILAAANAGPSGSLGPAVGLLVGLAAAASIAIGVLLFGILRSTRLELDRLSRSERRSRHIARHDHLTALPNRVSLAEELSDAIVALLNGGAPFALHCIDLDGFKELNDNHGHPVGDELMQRVAERLRGLCGAGARAFRLGADEFAVIQPGADADSATALARSIIAAVSEPFDLSADRVHTSCSIGVRLQDHTGVLDDEECLRTAELALNRARDDGRASLAFFSPAMDEAIREKRALQADLRDAIANNELTLVYQPQVDCQNRVIGLEALARWTHQTRGPVSPGIFIPLAEECGLIEELGWFAMRRAFEDGRRWPGVKIAVNVSAAQFRTRNYADRVRALVAETRADPRRFEIEITEGLLLADSPETHAVLEELRNLGFSIALDDFGTGYSSLSYIQRFPISRIKIDRSFVANLGVASRAEDVVGAIVRLARALGLSILAEGVETEEQRARLAAAGCGEIQGYLASRPLPVEQVQVFMDQARAIAA